MFQTTAPPQSWPTSTVCGMPCGDGGRQPVPPRLHPKSSTREVICLPPKQQRDQKNVVFPFFFPFMCLFLFFSPKEEALPDPPGAICSDLIKPFKYLGPPEERGLTLSTENTSQGCSSPGITYGCDHCIG